MFLAILLYAIFPLSDHRVSAAVQTPVPAPVQISLPVHYSLSISGQDTGLQVHLLVLPVMITDSKSNQNKDTITFHGVYMDKLDEKHGIRLRKLPVLQE